jgi:mannose-1-phosphate guanylyltransferase
MFVLKASVWLAAIEQFTPAIFQATRTAWEARKTDGAFVRLGQAEFEAIPSESVDYAVMEHCLRIEFPIQMVSLDAGWSDLGVKTNPKTASSPSACNTACANSSTGPQKPSECNCSG